MMKCPCINNAVAVNDITRVIEFDNKEVKKYDIRKLWDIPMFVLLRQPAFFKSFEIEPGGYGLVWNAEVDVSEYELWKNGVMVESEAIALNERT